MGVGFVSDESERDEMNNRYVCKYPDKLHRIDHS